MIRRLLPWLFLAAAVFSLIAVLSEKHPNLFYAGSRFLHVLIALAYLPHHHGYR